MALSVYKERYMGNPQEPVTTQSITSVAVNAKIPRGGSFHWEPVFMRYDAKPLPTTGVAQVFTEIPDGTKKEDVVLVGIAHGHHDPPRDDKPTSYNLTLIVNGYCQVWQNTGCETIEFNETVLVLPQCAEFNKYRNPKFPATSHRGGITVPLRKLLADDSRTQPWHPDLVQWFFDSLEPADAGATLKAQIKRWTDGEKTNGAFTWLGPLLDTAGTEKAITAKKAQDSPAFLMQLHKIARANMQRFILGRAMQAARPGKAFAVDLSINKAIL